MEILFSGGDTSHSAAVMAARVSTVTGEAVGGGPGGVTVGLALVDPASRQLLVAEFADNDQFTNLEVRYTSIHTSIHIYIHVHLCVQLVLYFIIDVFTYCIHIFHVLYSRNQWRLCSCLCT